MAPVIIPAAAAPPPPPPLVLPIQDQVSALAQTQLAQGTILTNLQGEIRRLSRAAETQDQTIAKHKESQLLQTDVNSHLDQQSLKLASLTQQHCFYFIATAVLSIVFLSLIIYNAARINQLSNLIIG